MYLETFCVKSFTSACCGAMKKSNISLIDGSPKLQIGCQCCHGQRLGINDKHKPQPCILIIINYFWQTCRHNDLFCKLSLIVWCLLSCATFCFWSEPMFIQLVSNHNVSIKMCHTCKWNFQYQNNIPHIYTRYSVKKFSRLVSSWQAKSNSKISSSGGQSLSVQL